MAVHQFPFTTGGCVLPDLGQLFYNGCTFSPLFESHPSITPVKTDDGRAIKYLDIVIKVDGYVTGEPSVLQGGSQGPFYSNTDPSLNSTTMTLVNLLTAEGGTLLYQGRGLDINVGPGVAAGAYAGPGALRIATRDVAWGPIPELLDYQPLGGGMSAKVQWQVRVRVPSMTRGRQFPLLQFSFESIVGYSEDGFSSISVKGVLEIPRSRLTQGRRDVLSTADDYRFELDTRIFAGIDLSRFMVTKRNYTTSRDKRTLEFDVTAEEKPYMDMPPDMVADGNYTVRPAKQGMGLATWLCTLRATYTVRNDRPRRLAWFAFLAMLRLRMFHSRYGSSVDNPANGLVGLAAAFSVQRPRKYTGTIDWWDQFSSQLNNQLPANRRAWLIDFSFDEGLYRNSKRVSFSATWRLVTTFGYIIGASGLWSKLPETDVQGNNLWATSMQNVQGSQSWLQNRLDPALGVIVDFGSPT